jgi:DNA-binding transcriptional ArsR family regulator
MVSTSVFAEVAAISGDPARASMLHALMDGRALTATELAKAAGITPQTASGHLAKMTSIGMLSVTAQGRHRYHRLSSPSIARMLESIMQVAAELRPVSKTLRIGPKDAAMRHARTCYDHFAGRLGVGLADALIERGAIELTSEAGILTDTGLDLLGRLGMDTAPLLARRTPMSGRVLCKPCLDWSERRPHLAGALGAALCQHSMRMGWTRRQDGTRAVLITRAGERAFGEAFGMCLAA